MLDRFREALLAAAERAPVEWIVPPTEEDLRALADPNAGRYVWRDEWERERRALHRTRESFRRHLRNE